MLRWIAVFVSLIWLFSSFVYVIDGEMEPALIRLALSAVFAVAAQTLKAKE